KKTIGLLRDLVRAKGGLERALAAALGPLADAVVSEDAERAIADVGNAQGAVFAVARDAEERRPSLMEPLLLAAVEPDPRVRGLLATILEEVYVAEDTRAAAALSREHPAATFVTRDGVLIGPTIVRTDAVPDGGRKELRAEIRQLDTELTGTR